MQAQLPKEVEDQKQSLLDQQQQSKYKFDDLQLKSTWGYAVGHFYNDLVASMWFIYLVYYYKSVLKLDFVPYIMLAGQIADAISTPLVGCTSDRFSTRYGKRTPWYIGGFIILIFSTILTWRSITEFYPNAPKWIQITYYIFFPCLLNVGWASVQISHMSLVPSLTCSRKKRDQLNGLRNSFTFLANILVLVIALFFFQFQNNAVKEFENIQLTITIIGVITSLIFIATVKEVPLTQACAKYIKQNKQAITIWKLEQSNIKDPNNQTLIVNQSINIETSQIAKEEGEIKQEENQTVIFK